MYGAGVGGGSLAFGAFTPVPRRVDFEHVFPGGADYDELVRTYYPRAKKMLGASPLPADIMAHPRYVGTRSWRATVRRYGKEPVSFDYAINWDVVRDELAGRIKPAIITGELCFGVNSGAKNSVDHNYLPAAEATGNVTIKPMHEVFEIRPRARRRGFVVSARVIDENHRTVRVVTLEADYLFLAAGSFHTTRMLVEARAKGTLPRLSPRIGDGFGANGDFLTARTALSDDYGAVQGGPGFGRVYEDDMPGGPVSMVYHSTPVPAPLGKTLTTNLIQAHTEERGTIDYDHATRSAVINYPHPEGNDLDRRGGVRRAVPAARGDPARTYHQRRARLFAGGRLRVGEHVSRPGWGGDEPGGDDGRRGARLREPVRRRRLVRAGRGGTGEPGADHHRTRRTDDGTVPGAALNR